MTQRMARWLIYGAYGYTGRLIASLAAERGLRPILAGRDRARVEALADRLGLTGRAFGLDDPAALDAGLDGVDAVLHTAGPFVYTWRPMVEACLRVGCHYLDITGEIDVLESLHDLDEEARAAGIALVPAVGFDVVPTDCAAVRVASRVDDPVAVEIAFHSRGGVSRGTLKTTIERLGEPSHVRRDGRIVDIELGSLRRDVPFSDRVREGVAIPWGDVSTAFHSTGVPDIAVYMTGLGRQIDRFGWLDPLLRRPGVRRLLTWIVERTTDGPDREQRDRGSMRVWAEARGADGQAAALELLCPDGYSFTADSAVTAVQDLLAPGAPERVGFLTPSRAFGADFVDRLAGVEWLVG